MRGAVSGTEYRRMVKFACPHCRSSFTGEVWVHDPAELEDVLDRCPVCGSMMERVCPGEEGYVFR